MERVPKHLKLDQSIYLELSGGGVLLNPSIREVLLSHAFAYSFWGDDPISIKASSPPVWQVNLQNMVLEGDPVDYLRIFIPNPD